jgi:predicted ATPase
MNSWHVITGGPSVGKTTLLVELEKLGYKTLPEAARVVIDSALKKNKTIDEIRGDEYIFQMRVLDHKLNTEQQLAHGTPTFFDRGMHDTLAYLKLHGFTINNKVKKAVASSKYKKVFLLEPLSTYEIDYARTETKQEASKLFQLLYDSYIEHGMKPIIVPSLPVEQRIDLILQHMD